jgi:hypothetical protein
MSQTHKSPENTLEKLPKPPRSTRKGPWALAGAGGMAITSLVGCNVPSPGPLETTTTTSSTALPPGTPNGEREADINKLHDQLEIFHTQNGKYPTKENLADSAWRTSNLKGLSDSGEELRDPDDHNYYIRLASIPTAGMYSYEISPPDCDNGALGDCTSFVLTAVLSPTDSGATYRRVSSTLEPPATTIPQ